MNDQIVSLENLEMIRAILGRVSTHLEAADVASAEGNMADRPTYRPLTVAVAGTVERVEGLIADFLLARHLADQGELPPSGQSHEAEADEGETEQDEVNQGTPDPSTEAEQLQLFDASTYENPPAVQQGIRKYRLLADE